MKSRIRNIIEILMTSQRGESLKGLSLRLDVSEKTIRDEINQYMAAQGEYPIRIVPFGKGYKAIAKENHTDLNAFLNEQDTFFEDPTDRMDEVLKTLLLKDDYIKIETLADQCYVSVPTMNRMIKKIKDVLSNYELSLESRPGYGIKIKGAEINKRLCYVHTLTKNTESSVESLIKQCEMEQGDYYRIDYILRKCIEEEKYDLTEMGIKNLAIHLMYAITRMKNGSFVESSNIDHPMPTKETKTANRIIGLLEKEFDLKFPDEEKKYVQIHLLSKRGYLDDHVVNVSSEVERVIDEVHHRIRQVAGLDFSHDLELLRLLAMHMEPMLSRIQYGIDIPNPPLKEIKIRFPTAYECAVIAADTIRERYDMKMSEDELGYLSIHYGLALERLNEKKAQKILVVCGSGAGTAKLLQKRIEKQFCVRPECITLASIREMQNMDLDPFDFIVSGVHISDSKGKRVIVVEDILSNFSMSDFSETTSLARMLNPNLVFFGQDLRSREEVIDFCCEKIKEEYHLDFDFKKEVWKREELSSTDIGNWVAIPHAFSRCTEETIFCVCTLKKAILWNQHKVKYIFLVSFGYSDLSISHDINEKLIGLILDSEWISMLDAVNTYQDLLAIL